jgi:hypothetical protein
VIIISRRMGWTGNAASTKKYAYEVLVLKPEGTETAMVMQGQFGRYY